MNLQKYQYCLDKIYSKYNFIKAVENRKSENYSEYTLDSLSVQFRKMVELFILGISLVHNEALVKAQYYFEYNCSGKRLFGGLEGINKKNFPYSVAKNNYIDRSKLHNFFEKSSHILHITNPFLLKSQKNTAKKVKKIFLMADEFIEMLNQHKITLYNGDVLVYERDDQNQSSLKIISFEDILRENKNTLDGTETLTLKF